MHKFLLFQEIINLLVLRLATVRKMSSRHVFFSRVLDDTIEAWLASELDDIRLHLVLSDGARYSLLVAQFLHGLSLHRHVYFLCARWRDVDLDVCQPLRAQSLLSFYSLFWRSRIIFDLLCHLWLCYFDWRRCDQLC